MSATLDGIRGEALVLARLLEYVAGASERRALAERLAHLRSEWSALKADRGNQ